MRSHARNTPPPPEPLGIAPIPLDLDTAEFLINDAAFVTSMCSHEYWTCETCGSGHSFGETVARTDPPRPGCTRICLHCLLALLLHRGAIVPGERFRLDPPNLITIRLQMAPLRRDRLPDRANPPTCS